MSDLWGRLLCACGLVVAMSAHAAPRVASYAIQWSTGSPLLVSPPLMNAGTMDTANVVLLSRFDDATMEMVPWAQGFNGNPRADVPLRLRALNPSIRLWMYALVGDFWRPPSYTPPTDDHSAYRDVFDAINAGNGWLYATDGGQWFENYRVNLADSATVRRLGDIYCRLIALHLFDGMFMDDCHTSIAWTNAGQGRMLDVGRAGFPSLVAMDSSRKVNIERLIARLHAVQPCLLVAVNGTGPSAAGVDVEMREGLGTLITTSDAMRWMLAPGGKWLKAECWTDEQCVTKLRSLRAVANFGGSRVIISAGPGRGWKPEGR